MPENRIADLFQIQNRYLRSVHLERDFADTSALQGYIVTDYAKTNLERMAAGLAASSGQRAWRITGDYGSGKSSFALVLAHLFAGRYEGLSPKIKKIIDFKEIGVSVPHFLPVLVTGSREPLSIALLRSLRNALQSYSERGRLPKVIDKIQTQLDKAITSDSDDNVIRLISEANTYVSNSGKSAGLLIILDELGKFLEFAALHPDRQDVYFLQKLAEAAMRSGKNPLFIVGLLHQGFNAYADQMSQSAQKEWEKVAGRFEELFFDQPLEQMAGLVANALNLRIKQLPRGLAEQAEFDMESALNLGWYGSAFNRKAMLENAASLYPLHPSILPVLVKLFSRFGQNERSLFSFLLSNEPFGLQDFAGRSIGEDSFYRLHNLYDYAQTAFGHRLSIQSYRSHWNHIDSVIESFHPTEKVELQILKTVGLLNLLDTSNLLASEDAVLLAVAGENSADTHLAKAALQRLQKVKKVLYHRGASGGYCLWPHTSVNLEKIYDDASTVLPIAPRISSIIADYLETRPLVARRHYIKTGNLRHFEVRYAGASDLDNSLFDNSDSSDGLIIIPLCETEEERQQALKFAKSIASDSRSEILFAIPEPLGSLSGLVQEAQRWQWIEKNTPELNEDRYAAEEVSRQIAASRNTLEKRIQSFIGLRQFAERTTLQWFHQGRPVAINNGRELLSRLSDICDNVYNMAPHIHNELVNRRSLSSAAAAARGQLMEQMIKSPEIRGFGIKGTPPAMSIYFSVLEHTGLHYERGSSYSFGFPSHDIAHMKSLWEGMDGFLSLTEQGRRSITDLFEILKKPPYGVRMGILPIFLLARILQDLSEIAIYEDGLFVPEPNAAVLERIIKAPQRFEIQRYRISGARKDIFERLAAILGRSNDNKKVSFLDAVRPLFQFIAKLPSYCHTTQSVSESARNVRYVLLNAREPHKVLFEELPKALSLKPIDLSSSNQQTDEFLKKLKEALINLQKSYDKLLSDIEQRIKKAFLLPKNLNDARRIIKQRGYEIIQMIADVKLKAFVLRLSDDSLDERKWLESVAMVVVSNPPVKWDDHDIMRFEIQLNDLSGQFKRIEEIAVERRSKRIGEDIRSVLLGITDDSGGEYRQLVHINKKDEKRINTLAAELINHLKSSTNDYNDQSAIVTELTKYIMLNGTKRGDD